MLEHVLSETYASCESVLRMIYDRRTGDRCRIPGGEAEKAIGWDEYVRREHYGQDTRKGVVRMHAMF